MYIHLCTFHKYMNSTVYRYVHVHVYTGSGHSGRLFQVSKHHLMWCLPIHKQVKLPVNMFIYRVTVVKGLLPSQAACKGWLIQPSVHPTHITLWPLVSHMIPWNVYLVLC